MALLHIALLAVSLARFLAPLVVAALLLGDGRSQDMARNFASLSAGMLIVGVAVALPVTSL